LGESVNLTCSGYNLIVADLVWQIFPLGSPLTTTVLYLTGRLGFTGNGKYLVNAEQVSPFSISSTLTINDLEIGDALYSYQCACNIYTACASGKKVNAVANITILKGHGKSSGTASNFRIYLYI
jgi:hypothetical protein